MGLDDLLGAIVCVGVLLAPIIIVVAVVLTKKFSAMQEDIDRLRHRVDRIDFDSRSGTQSDAPPRQQAPSRPARPVQPPPQTTMDALRAVKQRDESTPKDEPSEKSTVIPGDTAAGDRETPTTSPITQPASASASASLPPISKPSVLNPASGSATEGSPKFPANTTAQSKPPRRTTSLEESLSTKLYVWIGGVAIVFAGGLFLRFAFKEGWISPEVRLIISAIGGIGLIIGAFPVLKRAAHVAQAMAGAGIATLFGVVLAATHLYHFIEPYTAFAFMTALTAGAIILALRFGQFVALLGLLGGFMTPALIGTTDLSPGLLFTYLALLQIGLATLTLSRQWHWLSMLTLAGSLIWVLIKIVLGYDPDVQGWMMAFVMLTMVTFITGAMRRDNDSAGGPQRLSLSMVAGIAGLALFAVMTMTANYTALEFAMFGLVSAGCMVLGRFDRRFIALPVAALALVVLTLSSQLTTYAVRNDSGLPAHFMLYVTAFGLLFSAGSYACIWSSKHARLWSILSAVSGVTFLLLARIAPLAVVGLLFDNTAGPEVPVMLPWWLTAAIVSAVFAVAATPMYLRRDRDYAGAAIDALAAAVCASLALCVVFAFKLPNTVAAFVVLAGALALVHERLLIASVRWAAAILAAIAAPLLVVAVPTAIKVTAQPVANELLLVYGLSTVGFVIAAWRSRARQMLLESPMYELAAVGAALIGVTLIVRHSFHLHDMLEAYPTLIEGGTLATVWLVFAGFVHLLGRRLPATLLFATANVLLTAAVIVSGFVLLFMVNPLFHKTDVGDMIILNWMLFAYGLPAALMAVLYRLTGSSVPMVVARVLGFGALTLLFVHLNLEVRHAFHPQNMLTGRAVLTEGGTLATIWLLFAGGVHLLGRRLPQTLLLQAANVLLIAAVLASGILLLIVVNPLFHRDPVGDLIVFNWMLFTYGVPTLLMGLLYLLVYGRVPVAVLQVLGVGTLVLLFVHVNLEVRHYFHGTRLSGGGVQDAEWFGYSVAWILFACLLAFIGIVRRQAPLRWASLGVMLLAIGKVFLFDFSKLEGLYRVLSFLGLGVSLLIVGFIYQRLVFPAMRDDDDEQLAVDEPAPSDTIDSQP